MAGAGWSEAGAARAGERGGERAALSSWARREAGRPSSACPLSLFFEISFLQILSKFIWTNLKSFSALAPKNKVVPKQKLYHFALTSKTKFQTEFELQVKTQF